MKQILSLFLKHLNQSNPRGSINPSTIKQIDIVTQQGLPRSLNTNYFRRLLLLLLSCFLISATPVIVEAPQVLDYAQEHLAHHGTLEMTKEGFIYVKVSDDYIFETVKLLADDAIQPPPYFGKGKVGAHISVIDADESKGKQLYLPQLGQSISFKILEFASVDVSNGEGLRRIYLFIVEAPELAKIRAANGLSKKIRGFDFHITAAVERLKI